MSGKRGCWTPCAVRDKLQESLAQGLRVLGDLIGRKPKTVLASSLLLSLGICSCVVLADFDNRLEYVYVPRNAGSFDDFQSTERLFGKRSRDVSAVLFTRDGGSILRPEMLKWAAQTYAALLDSRNTDDNVAYTDVCERHPITNNCTVLSLFSFLTQVKLLEDGTFDDLGEVSNFQNARAVVKNLREQNIPKLDSVLSQDDSALRFVFPVASPTVIDLGIIAKKDRELELALSWEEAYLEELFRQRDLGVGRVIGMASLSVDKEVQRNQTGAIPFMMCSIGLILVFLAMILGGLPCRRSRLLLTLGTVVMIELAQGVGFALTALCGVPLTDISLLLVFLSVGVGVDDVIVLTDVFDLADHSLSLHERLAFSFQHAGKAVLVTSTTNLVAFLVASTSDLPAISWFCVSAGFVIFSLFVLTMTFYAPLLVLDERRRAAGLADCCLCCIPIKSDDNPVRRVSSLKRVKAAAFFRRSLKGALLPITSRPLPACMCVLMLSGLAACGVYCVSKPEIYTVGIPLAGAFPDDSYLTEYLDEVQPRYFGGMVASLDIIVTAGDFGEHAFQQKLLRLQDDFSKVPPALSNATFFLRPLWEWEICTSEGQVLKGAAFEKRLRSFLESPEFSKCSGADNVPDRIKPFEYAYGVAWDVTRVKAVRINLPITISTTVQGRIDGMQELRKIYASHGIPGYVFSYYFLFAERDEKLWELIGTTLIYAGVSVVLVVAIFVHPLGTILIALCIALIDFLLLAMMYIWDIPIDALSFICIAMAAGMSVDYVVHLAQAALNDALPDDDNIPIATEMRKRIEYALDHVGASVFKGASSTFLGILVLSMAPTMVFRLFFKMLCGIVFLGAVAGFIFFPSALTCCLLLRSSIRRAVSKEITFERAVTQDST